MICEAKSHPFGSHQDLVPHGHTASSLLRDMHNHLFRKSSGFPSDHSYGSCCLTAHHPGRVAHASEDVQTSVPVVLDLAYAHAGVDAIRCPTECPIPHGHIVDDSPIRWEQEGGAVSTEPIWFGGQAWKTGVCD